MSNDLTTLQGRLDIVAKQKAVAFLNKWANDAFAELSNNSGDWLDIPTSAERYSVSSLFLLIKKTYTENVIEHFQKKETQEFLTKFEQLSKEFNELQEQVNNIPT